MIYLQYFTRIIVFKHKEKMKNDDLDVDRVIDKLLEVRGCKPGKQVNLAESDIRSLCVKARDIFISQPILLELEAPIKICGK